MLVETSQVINGEEVKMVIEVDDKVLPEDNPYEDLREAAINKPLEIAKDLFGDAMILAKNCAISAMGTIRKLDKSIAPDEFELQVAICLNAEVGAVLTKIGGEAQIQVTMTWKHGEDNKK